MFWFSLDDSWSHTHILITINYTIYLYSIHVHKYACINTLSQIRVDSDQGSIFKIFGNTRSISLDLFILAISTLKTQDSSRYVKSPAQLSIAGPSYRR